MVLLGAHIFLSGIEEVLDDDVEFLDESLFFDDFWLEEEVDGTVDVVSDLGVFAGHVVDDNTDKFTLVSLEVRFAFFLEA